MGFSIYSEDGEFEGYLSYNFSKFSEYWYIRHHLDGHKASTVLKYLRMGLRKLAEEGCTPGIRAGEDEWTPEKHVFMFHLLGMYQRIAALVEIYPHHANVRYHVDGSYGVDYSHCDSEEEWSSDHEGKEVHR